LSTKLVRDLMRIGVVTCPDSMPFVEAARLLLKQRLESLIVLDGRSHAVGMLTRREVVAGYGRFGAHPQGYESLTVADVMRPDIPEIPPDIPATAAAQIMLDQGVREIYLLHHDGGIGWPAAVLRFDDILRYLAAETDEDLSDMGAGAARKTPMDVFKERYEVKGKK
jgi:CBS domain-containing protein